MIPLKIEIRDQGVAAALNRLIAAGEHLSPVLDAIGRQLKTHIQLGFQAGRDPYGTPWAPLKIRRGQPLQDKRHLMNSIDYRVEGASVEVGTNREHMRVHQFGARIVPRKGKFLVFHGPDGKLIFAKSVTIPPRPFLPLDGLPSDWREDILAVINDELARAASSKTF